MSLEDVLRTLIREELAALKFTGRQTEEDKLLTAAEAAEILHVSERYLYRHADKLSFAVRISPTVVRFSSNKIQAEIQRKLQMQKG